MAFVLLVVKIRFVRRPSALRFFEASHSRHRGFTIEQLDRAGMTGPLVLEDIDSPIPSADGGLEPPIEASSVPASVGIRALMLAVLDDAVRAYLGPVPRARAEAEHWVHDRRDGYVFAFETVCAALQLEPGAVRAALRRMQRDRCAAVSAQRTQRLRPNARRRAGLQLRGRSWSPQSCKPPAPHYP